MAAPVSLKEYFSALGSRFTEEQAQVIGPELERLAARGRATEMDIVHAATDPRSPLHPFFEWDNSEAARKYRLLQAREMARAVQVRVRTEQGRTV